MPPLLPEQIEGLKTFAVIVTIIGGISTALYTWAARPAYALVHALSGLQAQMADLSSRLNAFTGETQRGLGLLEGAMRSVERRLDRIERWSDK